MVRLVLAALSVSYMTGDARFENVDLIFTQPGYNSKSSLRARNHIGQVFVSSFFVPYQHEVPWYILDDAT